MRALPYDKSNVNLVKYAIAQDPRKMKAATLAVIIVAQFSSIRGAYEHTFSCLWHYKFMNFSEPQLKAVYYDDRLRLCYRDAARRNSAYFYSCIDSTDFFQFTNRRGMTFAKLLHLDSLIYDNSNESGQKSTMLSLRNVYPALIAISQQDAYSSVDYMYNQTWLKTCEDCIKSTVTNSEIFKSADGTFWASYNDNNRIITSTDMRTWKPHTNLQLFVNIHNLFPIKTETGEDKWIVVQVVVNATNYYRYYVGTMTHEDGFIYETGPYNLTYGHDDVDLFFANKGDVVDTSQIMLPTLITTYIGFKLELFGFTFGLLEAPIILATPRTVMFKDIGGVQRLVQVPAVDASAVPRQSQFPFHFENVSIEEGGRNVLNNICTRSFIVNMAFSLQNSKEVGIHIRKSDDGKERTQIGYLKGDVFYVDRGRTGFPAGLPYSNQGKYKRRFDAREPADTTNIKFLIYADGPLLEVFCDQGQINFNLLIFPLDANNRLEIITSRAPALLLNIDLFTYD